MWEWEEPGTLGISNSWPLCPEPRAPNSYHFGPSLPQTVTRSPSAPEPAPGSPPPARGRGVRAPFSRRLGAGSGEEEAGFLQRWGRNRSVGCWAGNPL